MNGCFNQCFFYWPLTYDKRILAGTDNNERPGFSGCKMELTV